MRRDAAIARTRAIVTVTWIGPGEPDDLSESPEVRERELEADREEQEDDAEVRQHLDDRDVAQEAEPEGPEQDARRGGTR